MSDLEKAEKGALARLTTCAVLLLVAACAILVSTSALAYMVPAAVDIFDFSFAFSLGIDVTAAALLVIIAASPQDAVDAGCMRQIFGIALPSLYTLGMIAATILHGAGPVYDTLARLLMRFTIGGIFASFVIVGVSRGTVGRE